MESMLYNLLPQVSSVVVRRKMFDFGLQTIEGRISDDNGRKKKVLATHSIFGGEGPYYLRPKYGRRRGRYEG